MNIIAALLSHLDKIAHFVFSGWFFFIGYHLAGPQAGFLLAITFSLLKEGYDATKTHFDWYDLLFDVLGLAFAALIVLVL